MKKITTYHESGRMFYICKDENGYWGIENKYVDKNGRVKIALNGLNGHLHRTLEETLASVKNEIMVDKLMAAGMTSEQAIRYMIEQNIF